MCVCMYQEPIRGGVCNATVGWVESLLENDVAYGCGKSIHSNFHSPYKESKDSRYIRWLWLYEQVSSRHRASSKRNLVTCRTSVYVVVICIDGNVRTCVIHCRGKYARQQKLLMSSQLLADTWMVYLEVVSYCNTPSPCMEYR